MFTRPKTLTLWCHALLYICNQNWNRFLKYLSLLNKWVSKSRDTLPLRQSSQTNMLQYCNCTFSGALGPIILERNGWEKNPPASQTKKFGKTLKSSTPSRPVITATYLAQLATIQYDKQLEEVRVFLGPSVGEVFEQLRQQYVRLSYQQIYT